MSRSFSAMVNSCIKAIEERITVFRVNPKTQPGSKLCPYTALIYNFSKRGSNGSLGIKEISCYNHIFQGNKILDSYWKRSGPRYHRYPSLRCCWMSMLQWMLNAILVPIVLFASLSRRGPWHARSLEVKEPWCTSPKSKTGKKRNLT